MRQSGARLFEYCIEGRAAEPHHRAAPAFTPVIMNKTESSIRPLKRLWPYLRRYRLNDFWNFLRDVIECFPGHFTGNFEMGNQCAAGRNSKQATRSMPGRFWVQQFFSSRFLIPDAAGDDRRLPRYRIRTSKRSL